MTELKTHTFCLTLYQHYNVHHVHNFVPTTIQTYMLIYTCIYIPLPMCSLELWGYKRVEELIWVKTNQLQRIIRTGRTGHWLNHSKEHCLIGIKGNPVINRNLDTDVLVAEVRETSRKPDEVLRGKTETCLTGGGGVEGG